MMQPTVFGSQGGATTLLLVTLITVLWLSITGRLKAVRAAMSDNPQSGTPIMPWVGGAEGTAPPTDEEIRKYWRSRGMGDIAPDTDAAGYDWLNKFPWYVPFPKIPTIPSTPPLSGPIGGGR